MGGFRIRGGETKGRYELAVLYTTFADPDWPDELEPSTGRFLYYGDNKTPGCELHDTTKGGNRLLRYAYEKIHVDPPQRGLVPPFFVFSKTGTGRDVMFHGLAAPGAPNVTEADDLVAAWSTRGRERFQNYRAIFTILGIITISRTWVDALVRGAGDEAEAPKPWREWVESGRYDPLRLKA